MPLKQADGKGGTGRAPGSASSGPIFQAYEGEMSITAKRRAERNVKEAQRQARLAERES